METEDDKNYYYDMIAPEPRKGYFRILIETEKENEYYSDVFFPTMVESQPQGLDLIRMYSMIPLASGKLSEWLSLFREIKRLGFDCVHLLPITQMGKSQSPYSAADLFSIDSMYAEHHSEFESFVEKAKLLKMRLCFDLVLNHISPDSKIAQQNPDWIQPDTTESDGLKRAGCWHNNAWIRWDDLVLINYDHPDPITKKAIWDAMKNYAMMWASYADSTKGMIRLDNLHSSNEAFISYLRVELKQAFPNLIIFAEFFADEDTLLKKSRDWDLNLLLGQPWHHDFVPQLRKYFLQIHKQGHQLHHVMPITTHDTPSIKQMYSDNCYTIPRYAAASLLSCGKTGITMGVEVGVEEKMKFIGEPYSFDIFQEHEFKKDIQLINTIVGNEPVLREVGNIKFIDHDDAALLVAYRKDSREVGEDALVLISMDKQGSRSFKLDLNQCKSVLDKTFIETYAEDQREIKHGADIVIPPCGYRFFKAKASQTTES